MSRRKYCLQILDDYEFLASKPASRPMILSLHLSATSRKLFDAVETSNYSRLIGKLLYPQISRLDLSFVIHKLNQYLANSRSDHLQAAHHILLYLKGTTGQGILLSATKKFQLMAFVDSDWGACLDT